MIANLKIIDYTWKVCQKNQYQVSFSSLNNIVKKLMHKIYNFKFQNNSLMGQH